MTLTSVATARTSSATRTAHGIGQSVAERGSEVQVARGAAISCGRKVSDHGSPVNQVAEEILELVVHRIAPEQSRLAAAGIIRSG